MLADIEFVLGHYDSRASRSNLQPVFLLRKSLIPSPSIFLRIDIPSVI